MFRTITLLIIFIFFIGTSLWAQNGENNKEILAAKKIEYAADSLFDNRINFRAALDSFYKAAILFERNKVWISAIKNYRQTALCHHFLKNNDSAQYFIDKSYCLFDKNTTGTNEKSMLEEAGIHYVRARISLRKRDFDSTFYYLDKGFEFVKKLNAENNSHKLLMAKFFQTYGSTNYAWGKFDASLKFNFKALRIRQEELKPSDLNIIDSYSNIFKNYYSKSDFDKAEQYLWYIIENSQNYPNWTAATYNNLAVINISKKRYSEAVKYYNKAQELYKENGDTLKAAFTMSNLGKAYAAINDYESALKILKEAIKIRKRFLGKSHPDIAHSIISLGDYYMYIKNYEEELKCYSEALILLKNNLSAKDKLLKCDVYRRIGFNYLKQGALEKALGFFQHAITEIVEGFDYNNELKNPQLFFEGTNIINDKIQILSKPSLYDYLILKAITYNEMYENNQSLIENLQKSHKTYLLALKLLKFNRLDISEGESKYFLSAEEKINYRNAINVCLKLDSLFPKKEYSNSIFDLIEKCKSPSLRDKYYVSKALSNSNIPKRLIEREKEVTKKLAFYRTYLSKNKQKSEIENKNYKVEYEKLSVEHDTIIKYFEKTYPDYYKLKYNQEIASVKEVQHQLEKGAVLINYFVKDTSVYITAITKDKFDNKIVKIDSLFHEKIIDYYLDIEFEFTKDELETSVEIYQLLLKPIEELITDKSKLIIIPDEYLYYIPFETLCKKTSLTNDLSKVDFLIKNYTISYHHSATLWLNSVKKSKNKTIKAGNFIGFAPIFDVEAGNGYILSNEWISDSTNNELVTRTISEDFKHFNSLPNSKEEIESIVKLFAKKKEKAIGYFYREASEENFKHNVKDYGYIHIASHSFTNDLYPNLSGIAFSQPDISKLNGKKSEDGILYASETYSLELSKAELVVLSSCKSGLGKLLKAEGFLSLSRGFIFSGVPNILFSIWSVHDEQTKELMVEFYNQLLLGKDYADALRQAKLKLLRNKKFADTKYWAAWILMGE